MDDKFKKTTDVVTKITDLYKTYHNSVKSSKSSKWFPKSLAFNIKLKHEQTMMRCLDELDNLLKDNFPRKANDIKEAFKEGDFSKLTSLLPDSHKDYLDTLDSFSGDNKRKLGEYWMQQYTQSIEKRLDELANKQKELISELNKFKTGTTELVVVADKSSPAEVIPEAIALIDEYSSKVHSLRIKSKRIESEAEKIQRRLDLLKSGKNPVGKIYTLVNRIRVLRLQVKSLSKEYIDGESMKEYEIKRNVIRDINNELIKLTIELEDYLPIGMGSAEFIRNLDKR